MSKPIYVLGAGGHAKVIIDALLSQGLMPSGVVDPAVQPGDKVIGIEVIGGDEVLQSFAPDSVWLANGVGATPKSRVNAKLFDIWRGKDYRFINVRHASAIVSAHAQAHEGSQIMAGAVVQAAAVIGAGVVVNTGARIDHDCVIGQHCFIAPSVTMCGGVQVGERTFIGAGAVLLPGVRVGSNALIAANAVVDADVADGGCVLRA
ncbi:NeuD/PglB/VioB family sugar acetyltransferase [Chromobacterium sp. ASV23]|uniref:NeuD/PglB/VioB family sugar acetyltransferase n=1 Tax=Chromobacterium sp. ASV23 TaxID=2795110 RepID=UPI0018EA520B|nr:NeuD/PglB/VioB family sugar acetyltransferase [Chromobacterium sp. ASV23]